MKIKKGSIFLNIKKDEIILISHVEHFLNQKDVLYVTFENMMVDMWIGKRHLQIAGTNGWPLTTPAYIKKNYRKIGELG